MLLCKTSEKISVIGKDPSPHGCQLIPSHSILWHLTVVFLCHLLPFSLLPDLCITLLLFFWLSLFALSETPSWSPAIMEIPNSAILSENNIDRELGFHLYVIVLILLADFGKPHWNSSWLETVPTISRFRNHPSYSSHSQGRICHNSFAILS